MAPVLTFARPNAMCPTLWGRRLYSPRHSSAPVGEGIAAEPYDLVAEMPKFSWPTVVVSGGRDLSTPPAVAERVASLLPDAVLLKLQTMGHSALDTREQAALVIASAVGRGELDGLADRAPTLDALPARLALRLLTSAIGVVAAVEGAPPAWLRARRNWVPGGGTRLRPSQG
jgi:proline iminopeptidase